MSFKNSDFWRGYRAAEGFWNAVGSIFGWIGTLIGGLLFPSFRVRSHPRGREGRETRALYDKVKRLFDVTPLGQGGGNGFAVTLAFEAFERAERKPYIELIEPFINATVDLMVEDGLWSLPEVDWERPWGLEEGVELRKFLGAQRRFFGNYERYVDIWREKLIRTYEGMLGYFPEELTLDDRRDDDEPAPGWSVPLIDLAYDVPEVVERLIATMWDKDVVDTGLYARVRERFDWNALVASGIDPKNQGTTGRAVVFPTKARWDSASELVERYLCGTAFAGLLTAPYPFSLPSSVRFEHCHIVGGTGHGKTQLLQSLIYRDLMEVVEGNLSLCVIDSQGDMLRTLSHLTCFSPSASQSLADRLVLIDPTDTAYPVCLNMFDLHRGGTENVADADRERILNATVELYEYLFGALLGAEMTQRQGVVFRYLARLMMVIPGANVHTLRELMEDGEPFRKYVAKLDKTAQAFFRTQFFSPGFAQTKKQILARLWGVLSNPVFDRMFSHERNTVDLFEALNSGKVVLVNTAKELLQKDGSQILGRFFIALIAQAALKRAPIAKEERLPAFIYIDEAHEYFDEKIEDLLNQARKYRVGITLAHQNLDQLSTRLKATIMASTSVKLVGGVSLKDAVEFAREMRCSTESIEDTRKTRYSSTFACSVRNVTHHPVKISIPLGAVEELPTMSEEEYDDLLAANRSRYCAPAVAPTVKEWDREEEKQVEEAPWDDVETKEPEEKKGSETRPAPAPESPLVKGEAGRAAARIGERGVQEEIKETTAKREAPSVESQSQQPATLAKRQKPKPEVVVSQPKPLPAEVPLGRGGREHKYLQELLKQLAESRGFRATIEEAVLQGSGRVDVSLVKADTRIACEISVTSSAEQEVGNVRKCLEAGYTQVVLLSSEKRRITSLKKVVSSTLRDHEREKVLFFLPEEFISYLDTLEVPTTGVQTVRGYTVKVKYHAMGEVEQKARRDAIGKVIVASMKRMKKDEWGNQAI